MVDAGRNTCLSIANSQQAGKAVNISLTMRNWIIGLYIAEFEMHGADRAGYGDKLLASLAAELEKLNVSACGKL